jgi:hypothetical protein
MVLQGVKGRFPNAIHYPLQQLRGPTERPSDVLSSIAEIPELLCVSPH